MKKTTISADEPSTRLENPRTQLHEAGGGQERLFKHQGPGESNQPDDHEGLEVPGQKWELS